MRHHFLLLIFRIIWTFCSSYRKSYIASSVLIEVSLRVLVEHLRDSLPHFLHPRSGNRNLQQDQLEEFRKFILQTLLKRKKKNYYLIRSKKKRFYLRARSTRIDDRLSDAKEATALVLLQVEIVAARVKCQGLGLQQTALNEHILSIPELGN